uniref:DUF6534 domain-containing protein n=1 Tax=Mycena chlorophos TaxID=658473 RepID=A0ABQ0LL58_MYCCL|nr:predicted protein [Mycena chlorophos]
MKFSSSSFAMLAASLALVAAQSIDIGAPADGSTVTAGSNVVVEVDRPDSLTGSTEVAIVIGLATCQSAGDCPAPLDFLGTILYNGPYSPEFQNNGSAPNKPPYQNFTVTIPEGASGPSQLNVLHLALVGASEGALLEAKNISLTVALAVAMEDTKKTHLCCESARGIEAPLLWRQVIPRERRVEQSSAAFLLAGLRLGMPLVDLNLTLGPLVCGAFVCCMFYGVITLQLGHYLQNYYHEDRLYVFFLFISHTGFTICMCQGAYTMSVTEFGETFELLYSPWGLNVAQVLGGVVDRCVEAFLVLQIYRATSSLHLCLILWLFVALLEALALVLAADFFRTHSISISIASSPYNHLFLLLFVTGAATDLVNASVLSYHLWKQRKMAFSVNTATLMDRLLVYTLREYLRALSRCLTSAIETGVTTSVMAVATAIAYIVAPNNYVWIIFFICMPCSFMSAFLANLNNRGSLRLSHTSKGTATGTGMTSTNRGHGGGLGMQIQISRSVLQSISQDDTVSRFGGSRHGLPVDRKRLPGHAQRVADPTITLDEPEPKFDRDVDFALGPTRNPTSPWVDTIELGRVVPQAAQVGFGRSSLRAQTPDKESANDGDVHHAL